jgi:hypothetical protein
MGLIASLWMRMGGRFVCGGTVRTNGVLAGKRQPPGLAPVITVTVANGAKALGRADRKPG